MDNIPSDVIRDIITYLTDFEILQFSNTAKFDLEFNRDKHKKNIIYKKLIPMLTLGPNNVLCWESRLDIENIKHELYWSWDYEHPTSAPTSSTGFSKERVFGFIHTLSDKFLKSWRYPIYEPYLRLCGLPSERPPYYFVDTFAFANTRFAKPEFYNGSKILKKKKCVHTKKKVQMCMLYRVNLWSMLRSDIKNSLTLRALVG